MHYENGFSIIGCGHLGSKLANFLSTNSSPILGTSRSLDKLRDINLTDKIIFSYPDNTDELTNSDIFKTKTLFISISPRGNDQLYLDSLSFLSSHFQQNQEVIFCSSTSIYPQLGTFSESFVFEGPQTERSKTLREAERIIREKAPRYKILRLGGLFDDQRHPAMSLSKRDVVSFGEAPVNLIHTQDICELIPRIVEIKENLIINMVSSLHPSKRDFYTKECERLELKVPDFTMESKERVIVPEILGRYSLETKNSDEFLG